MYRVLINIGFILSLPIAGLAQENDYLVDSVYGLRDVQDLEIETGSERLLVTLSDKVLYFDLFPLSLIYELPLEMDAASGSLSKRGNLFVVGEQDTTGGARGPLGKLQVLKDFKANGPESDSVSITLDTTPISAAFFNGAGEFFAVGPTRYSVLNISELAFLDGLENGSLVMNDLLLQCGTSAQFSVFKHDDRLFYVSSVNGAKVIEYGPADPFGASQRETDCFNPNRLLASRSKLSTNIQNFSPVRHAMVNSRAFIDDNDAIEQALLTFDVDERALVFFPFDYYEKQISIIRSESIQFKLDKQLGPPDDSSDFGLLASDKAAEVILLSYYGSKVVHRLSWQEDRFEYLGRFDTDKPIKSLYITPLGDFAAILSGDLRRDGDEELTIVKWPGAVPRGQELGVQRFSVNMLQRELSDTGVRDLKTDGILGVQTREALDIYLEQATGGTPVVDTGSASSSGDITIREPENALRQTIRGLFPLQEKK